MEGLNLHMLNATIGSDVDYREFEGNDKRLELTKAKKMGLLVISLRRWLIESLFYQQVELILKTLLLVRLKSKLVT